MTLIGTKKGKTVLLDIEPPVADGTKVEVAVPEGESAPEAIWEAQRKALLSVGYDPELADNIERAHK